jgi:hypothetical protein
MSNTLSVIDMVARESLRIAHEKLSFIGTVDRSYDDSYARTGAKIGSTLKVRNPNQYTRRHGSRVMDIQDTTETTQTITVATQDGVDLKFNSAELSLSVDELSRRYIEPAVSVLVSGIEGDMMTAVTKEVAQLAGTAGTVVGASDISALGAARAKLNQQLAPKDGNRFCQLDSVTMASVATKINTLFHPSAEIERAYREGYITRTAMAEFYENERTYSHTNGDDVAGAIDETAETNFTQGTTKMHVDALGSTCTVGSVFTIADVYDCHPETKQRYSHLKQFTVVSATFTGSNEADIVFSPAIYTTGAKQNISTDLAYTAAGWNNKVVTFVGSASTAYRHNLMYHKDAFAFVTADLPIMDDAAKCVRRVQDGLSLRVWQGSDIRNDELLMRIDILYGWKTLRPEWACRITN